MVLFQYGVALHELETERIRSGEITLAEKREILEGIWRKTKRQTLKDYVAFPLLAGPFAPWVFAGNMTANLMRNVWSYMIIFCGHFPEDVQEFSIEETKAETRGMWYFRQILGSANLTGGKLFHILSGNLSFQIEHHLFPDVPAHRHAEIAPEVQEICKRYGIPYNSGLAAQAVRHGGAQDRQAGAAVSVWQFGHQSVTPVAAAIRLDGGAAPAARLSRPAVDPHLAARAGCRPWWCGSTGIGSATTCHGPAAPAATGP